MSILEVILGAPTLHLRFIRFCQLEDKILRKAVLFSALPIAAKWLLIGKWKQKAIPIWSLRYFRFWVVKRLIRSAPMPQFGGPFYNLYLRLLGAKIGPGAVIHAKYLPVCTDLIAVGSDTIVRKDSVINGYKA